MLTYSEKQFWQGPAIVIVNKKWLIKLIKWITIAHHWRGSYSTRISSQGVWGVSPGVQVFKREIHTHVHLDYTRIKLWKKN